MRSRGTHSEPRAQCFPRPFSQKGPSPQAEALSSPHASRPQATGPEELEASPGAARGPSLNESCLGAWVGGRGGGAEGISRLY